MNPTDINTALAIKALGEELKIYAMENRMNYTDAYSQIKTSIEYLTKIKDELTPLAIDEVKVQTLTHQPTKWSVVKSRDLFSFKHIPEISVKELELKELKSKYVGYYEANLQDPSKHIDKILPVISKSQEYLKLVKQ